MLRISALQSGDLGSIFLSNRTKRLKKLIFQITCLTSIKGQYGDKQARRSNRRLNFLTATPLLLRKVLLLLLFWQKCWIPTPVWLLFKSCKNHWCINEIKHKLALSTCSGFLAKLLPRLRSGSKKNMINSRFDSTPAPVIDHLCRKVRLCVLEECICLNF